jgi:hypothetical protein
MTSPAASPSDPCGERKEGFCAFDLNSNLLTGETGGERRRGIGVGVWETEKVIGIWPFGEVGGACDWRDERRRCGRRQEEDDWGRRHVTRREGMAFLH